MLLMMLQCVLFLLPVIDKIVVLVILFTFSAKVEHSQRKRDPGKTETGTEELGAGLRIPDSGADRRGSGGADLTGAYPVESSHRQEPGRGNSGGGRAGPQRMGRQSRGERAENTRRHGGVHTGAHRYRGV